RGLGLLPSQATSPRLHCRADRPGQPEGSHMTAPVALFACIHNSGRSVAARVLAEHYGQERIRAVSAGSEPGEAINPVVAQVLAERGLSTLAEVPKKLEYDTVAGADTVITMGCGETCPVAP